MGVFLVFGLGFFCCLFVFGGVFVCLFGLLLWGFLWLLVWGFLDWFGSVRFFSPSFIRKIPAGFSVF